jgi:alpha-galactosidase
MLHLSAGGVSVVLDDAAQIVHWGAAVADHPTALAPATTPPLPRASFDVPVPLTLLPDRAAGWRGRPAPASFGLPTIEDTSVTWHGAGATVVTELELEPAGVLRLRHTLRNDRSEPFAVPELACVLPVPAVAGELLDLTGRWCRERHPQRRAFDQGTWLRQTRHGRTGHDAPLLLVAGTPGFSSRGGEVWGVHLGWSGNASWWAERLPDGSSTLGAAELFEPGELVLAPDEEYATPWLYAAWSDRGLDGLSARLHRFIRSRPSHPRKPRPVVLNTWEAVYFDHRLDRLTALADTAAELGVERFVLDDGWFRHRRDDTAGLGDWYVDEDVWPQGLHPLVDHVRDLGMEFGLWVEPEMVNPDSDLARAHPDWVLPGPPSRHQQGLDLTIPAAYGYVLERLDALLSDYDIAFLKWDHNRDLVGPVHEQTLAAYRLIDELRARHPGVEIESCSSGGARVDLGILARTDRVWASDTNDALERQNIQRWTQLLLPPELVGSHVGPPRAHTTGRTHDLSFRVAAALFGHFGIEWDINGASEEERAELGRAIALFKRMRGLLHTGEVVHADLPDPAFALHGVVAADRAEALFCFVALATSASERPGAVRLPGLDADRLYRVDGLDREITLSGRALDAVGVQMPVLGPEQALLLQLAAR